MFSREGRFKNHHIYLWKEKGWWGESLNNVIVQLIGKKLDRLWNYEHFFCEEKRNI